MYILAACTQGNSSTTMGRKKEKGCIKSGDPPAVWALDTTSAYGMACYVR
jgi:hypothetical protein